MINKKGLFNRIMAVLLSVGITLCGVMPIYAVEADAPSENLLQTQEGTGNTNNISNTVIDSDVEVKDTSSDSLDKMSGNQERGLEDTPAVSPEVTPEASPEVTPEASPEVTPEVTPEAEVTPVAVPESEDASPLQVQNDNAVNGKVEINGDPSSWDSVTAQNGEGVDNWKVVKSEDNSSICFSYTGTANSQWDYTYASYNNRFTVKFADGSEWSYCVVNENGVAKIKGAYYEDVVGNAIIVNNANHNNPASYFIEFSIPIENLRYNSDIVSISYGGTTVEYNNVQQYTGENPEPTPEPVYSGIVNDGDFSDWNAVNKYTVSCPTDEHSDCILEIATVWDGDKFHLYIKEGSGTSATLAGSHSNGKFAIKSDLGYEIDFQLNRDGTISGLEGVSCCYVGNQWEITFPESILPHYNKSLNVELYNGATLVQGITNLDGSENENAFSGITFDGDYSDWEDYPHSSIQYATSGSQFNKMDAKGSLYMDDANVYAHVKTEMPSHLNQGGGEFTQGVSFIFNSANPGQDIYSNDAVTVRVRYVAVDENGNINWNPQLNGLEAGKTYTFYAADLSAWGSSSNINNLNEHDTLFGKMVVTVGANGCDEMEMYLDKALVAKRYNMDVSELKLVNAQFIQIGDVWIKDAGTSSGPYAGVLICMLAVLVPGVLKKKLFFC